MFNVKITPPRESLKMPLLSICFDEDMGNILKKAGITVSDIDLF